MTLFEMAKNFAASVAEWVDRGAPVVTEEQFQQRVETCHTCEFFDAEAFGGKGRCQKCGCSSYKLFLATAKCPIDKWGRTIDPTTEMLKRVRKD